MYLVKFDEAGKKTDVKIEGYHFKTIAEIEALRCT